MSDGWIRLYRKIQKNHLWKEPRKFSRAEAWLDILMEVRWSDEPGIVVIKNCVLTCNRGESLYSLDTWAKRWGWTKSATRRFLDLLKKLGQIDTQSETHTTRLRVCNYEAYQSEDTQSETGMNLERNANETQATPTEESKESKERKKVKKTTKSKFTPPTLEEVQAYATEKKYLIDPQAFCDYYEAADWHDAKGKPVKNWKRRVVTWHGREKKRSASLKDLTGEARLAEQKRLYELDYDTLTGEQRDFLSGYLGRLTMQQALSGKLDHLREGATRCTG